MDDKSNQKLISDVTNQIKALNPNLVQKTGGDDVLTDYINRSLLYVTPLGAPDVIKTMLVRLWAMHLMTVDQASNVTSKHVGDLSVAYADTSKQDDDPLAEFKALLSAYGLGLSRLSGF